MHLIDWGIFDFFYITTKENLMTLDRQQIHSILYQVCVFRADHGIWFADTLSASPMQPLNGMWRNFTGRKYSTTSAKFVVSGWLESKDCNPGLCQRDIWLLLCNHGTDFDENGQGARAQCRLELFFFWLIGKRRWPMWPLISWYIFEFSPAAAEQNLGIEDKEQVRNVLYQFYGFLFCYVFFLGGGGLMKWNIRSLLCNRLHVTGFDEAW